MPIMCHLLQAGLNFSRSLSIVILRSCLKSTYTSRAWQESNLHFHFRRVKSCPLNDKPTMTYALLHVIL